MAKRENYEANKAKNDAYREIVNAEAGDFYYCAVCDFEAIASFWIENYFKCPNCGNSYE